MTIEDEELSRKARLLASTIEPFTGQVYFSPECHKGYEMLGFSASPGTFGSDVQVPDGPAYFTSRGGLMGQVPGELVAAAFGVFNPAVIVPAVAFGWRLTDAPTICAARSRGAIGQLARVLGDEPEGTSRAVELLQRATEPLRPEGRPLFAGVRSQPLPDSALGTTWQLADQLREFRGDSHVNAWTAAGLDPVEIGMLSEYYWGMPSRSYIRSRGWGDDDLDAGDASMMARGWLAGGALTREGREAREAIEHATDRQMRPAIEALGDDFDELVGLVKPWSRAIQQAGGYPGFGPNQLADLSKILG
jgi:hypothetical protein